MELPKPPPVGPVNTITPSFYSTALRCKAAAAWSRFGDRTAFPPSPFSLTGRAFHTVMEAAWRGAFPAQDDLRRSAALAAFEREAERLLVISHPYLRFRFGAANELPYFYRLQAQAAEATVRVGRTDSAQRGASAPRGRHSAGQTAERTLRSSDFVIEGRPDLVDESERTVYDYKTGTPSQEEVSESEARQLRLYAYLCAQNGVAVERGVIVRPNGRRDEIGIATDDANAEAESARAAMREFNRAAIRGSFADLATPSASTCRSCRCLPLCERFWEEAQPEWSVETGDWAEGQVVRLQRIGSERGKTMALSIDVQRGATPRGVAHSKPLPIWVSEADGSETIRLGDLIRAHWSNAAEVWRVADSLHT